MPDIFPLGATRADLDAVTAIVRRSGTSFYQGMRILPPDRRQAMYAVYAFCRLVDDIADDDAAPLADKTTRLDAWHDRIDALYAGRAEDAVTRVLLAAINRFSLRREDFRAVIDGMAMDAGEPIVAPTLVMLDLYCDRVAAAVGRLSVRVFGDASPAADRVAFHLGRALQLTNILRDLDEDAARDRLYLPREWLQAAGVPLLPKPALHAAGLPVVCRQLAEVAHGHFRDAEAAMRDCDKRAMRAARLMAATYAAILTRLDAGGWTDPSRRIGLPTWQKLWLALRHAWG